MGTCGISHRWSSSRDDWSRSSSSNNSDIEDLRQVIVLLFFRSLTAFPHGIVLTCCWTTGRQQPWWCHIWPQLTLRPSHQAPNNLTRLQTISQGRLQTPTCNKQRSVPRQFILVAAHKSYTRRTQEASACSHQFYYNANTMMSASWLVPVSLFPGWLRHAATYSEASSLPRLIRSHRVPTRPP